eukprot:jgi/Botrbrau1/14492/Bobra.0014s0126.1
MSVPTAQPRSVNSTSVTLHWDQPDDGGSKIQEYLLEYTRVGHGCKSRWWPAYQGTACEATFGQLRSGTSYYFRVTAYNKVGKSVSKPTLIITMDSVPDAPGLPLASWCASGKSVQIKWQPPRDGGRPLTYYDLEFRRPRISILRCGLGAKLSLGHRWRRAYQV